MCAKTIGYVSYESTSSQLVLVDQKGLPTSWKTESFRMENGVNHRLVCVLAGSDPKRARANQRHVETAPHDWHQERVTLEDSKIKETLKIANKMILRL